MNRLSHARLSFSSYLAAFFVLTTFPAGALDSPALSLARELNEAFIQVADKVSQSVVVIEVTEKPTQAESSGAWWDMLPRDEQHRRRQEPMQGEGSGIIVSADGYILTNDHVVEEADTIKVRLKDGRTFSATVKGKDSSSDIAVIQIHATNLSVAKLGDSDATRVGEFVVAIGAPFALSYSVTVGHVSAKGRSFERGFQDQDFIQTDASINPGNSGGPLVNLYGEVVAINTMIEGMNTGIGFAVPINLAKRVKDHLIAGGKRSWIGVGIAELKEYREFQDAQKGLGDGLEYGVVITGIVADGPAAKGGLKVDDVVVAINGAPIKSSHELQETISLEKAGKTLALDVVRNARHVNIKVQIETRPDGTDLVNREHPPQRQGGRKMELGVPALGFTAERLTPELAERYDLRVTTGVLITSVDEESIAEKESIRPGDVIKTVNHQPINSLRQLKKLLDSSDAKKGLVLEIITEGGSRIVVLKPQ